MSIALSVFVPVILSLVSYKYLRPEWIAETKVSWGSTLSLAALFSAATTTLALFLGPLYQPDPRLVALSIISWIMVITFITDLTTYKIPRGVSRLAYFAGVAPLLWAAFIGAGFWGTMFAAIGLLIVPLILIFFTGIGTGDIRLIILFAITLPWWITVEGWFHAFALSAVIGFVHIIFASIFKKGSSTMTVKTSATTRKIQALFGKDITETKEKRIIPFGPALLLGFWGYALYSLFTHQYINLPFDVIGFI